jgi:hypothetical protein
MAICKICGIKNDTLPESWCNWECSWCCSDDIRADCGDKELENLDYYDNVIRYSDDD